MSSLILFLGFFTFYLFGTSPTLYGGDCGELIAGAHVLGIPHAPGYPLYVILGKFGSTIIPFGNVAFRVNGFSAVISSFLVLSVFWLFRRLLKEEKASFLSSFILGLTPLFTDQARGAEVFNLNLLFIVGILLSLAKGRKEPQREFGFKWVLLGIFFWGLGFGNHHTILFLAPVMAWELWRSRTGGARFYFWTVAFFLLGFSIYIFLPIRAHINPPVNFGNPDTWDRFWAVITRKEFGSLSLHPAAVAFRDKPLLIWQSIRFGERIFSQLNAAGLILLFIGTLFGFLKKETRTLTLLGFSGFIAFGAGFEIYSNLSPGSSIAQWRLERFLMIPLFCGVGLMAVGLTHIFHRGKWMTALGYLIVVLFFIQGIPGFARAHTLRDNHAFRDFSISALRSAPKESWFIIDRVLFDEPTSALLVRTQVEKKRPDVRFLYRPGTLFESLYGDDVLELCWEDRYRRQKEVETRLLTTSSAPIRALAFQKENVPISSSVLRNLLYMPAGEAASPSLSLSQRGPFSYPDDYPRRLISVHNPYLLGKEALEKGNRKKADRFFKWAQFIGRDMAWLSSNIGSVYVKAGLNEEAGLYFERAVREDPYFFEGQYGWGYVQLVKGDKSQAAAAYETAVKLDPTSADGFYMLGICYSRIGDVFAARKAFEKFLILAPNSPQVAAVQKELDRLAVD